MQHSVTQTAEAVKPQWIVVTSPAWAFGFADSCEGKPESEGYRYFAGGSMTEYLKGWEAGLNARVREYLGWEPEQAPEASERRKAIVYLARNAKTKRARKTAHDAAIVFDRGLYLDLSHMYPVYELEG